MSTAHLRPADGPLDPPSSRPRAGVLAAPVFSFAFDPASGVQRVDVPGLEHIEIAPATVLHWAFYSDEAEATVAPHAALAVTVDVRFDDGTRLSDDIRVRDRYDFPIGADAQFAAKWTMPEQWNADTVSLAPAAGRTGTVELLLGAAEVAARGSELPPLATGFAQVLVDEHRLMRDAPPVELVDTRRGTHSGPRFSRGNTIPAVAVPHGFTFVTPATDAADSRWPYRPSVHDDLDDLAGRRLEALQFSHQPSPWIGDRAVLQLMPFFDRPTSVRADRRRWIVPGTERARPHEYAADLGEGLRVAMTATDHCGAFRVESADADARVGFVIDQLTGGGRLRWSAPERFDGWIPEGSAEWGNAPRGYFAGIVLGADDDHGMLDDDGRGRVAGFVAGRGSLEVRIAISFLSVEQARRSLASEAAPGRSFDALRAEAAASWNRVLGRVTIPPLPDTEAPYRALAHEENRSRIAAALHRIHLYPNSAAENAGTDEAPAWRFADVFVPARPHGEENTGASVAEGTLVVNNGYWDTYRTEWPALALLDPQLTGRLLGGQLEQYRRGGWMARWSAPGYVDSMVGTSSDQIFADAERWGLAFDRDTAFESGWRNACEPGPDPRRGRKGIGRGRFTGYISSDVPEGMSWSIENAVSDAALGRFASLLAAETSGEDAARYRSFARYFANRALSYRSLFDAGTGFFRGRARDGSFADDFDPRVWGGDNVETNAWGMSVGAVHDGDGLARLHGGPAALGRHLDALFDEPETADPRFGGAYGTVIHEQREGRAMRAGMCAISNQPAHHIPFMYAFSDRPWRSAAVVHDLARRLFAGAHIGQGFPGDEDNGEMSAWWLWAALGLYPLELASGRLRIGSPLFDDIRVERGDGSSLRIRTLRSEPAAHVLQSARLNGVALGSPELPIDELTGAAELELVFGTATGSSIWGDPGTTGDAVEWCGDLSGGEGSVIASPSVTEAARLFDDGDPLGDEGTLLAADEWAGWSFTRPRRISDVTVTAAAGADSSALHWEALTPEGTWGAVSTTHRSPLPPDRTTAFTLVSAVTTTAIRVRTSAPVVLRQLEFFDLD
ncbi:glycoside hydrolase domain-containing protein [Microbacterium sp.]|uniref:glycoside hydrolase domain-containing protein n=1 Tax=Microbacterium sp. TaxID=51671 RepID=UPI0028123D8D|nr:glycoside hydrolase domain-containing protein [Microbacterium sp.]